MTLLGLSLQQLALLFGATGAAVTLLYVLKLRRRRVRVPFSKLWERVLKQRESSSLFRRLKRLLSLLLQLAFLFLLIAALGDPRLSTRVLEGRHIILLLDRSASMTTRDEPGGRTRLQSALERARDLVRGMSGSDLTMVVAMDAQVTPLSGFESDEKRLLELLGTVTATDTRADLTRALKFCADALHGRQRPTLVLVSDGAHDPQVLAQVQLGQTKPTKPAPKAAEGGSARPAGKAKARAKPAQAELTRVDLRGVDLRYVPVGRSDDNVGIVAFNARRYVRNKLSFEVFMEVVNYRAKPAVVDLQLYADGRLIDVQRLDLPAKQSARYTCDPEMKGQKRRSWCELAATGELLEARLVQPGIKGKTDRPVDSFAADNRTYALLPERKRQRVLLVTKGNLYLEGAMLLDPNIEVDRIAPGEYSRARARRADAIIFDNTYPSQPPEHHCLVINPPTKGSPVPVAGRLSSPLVTEQDASHPVMRWVTLKDVNMTDSARFSLRPGVTSLAASFRQPIIVATETKGRKTVVIGFDLKRSDLPLRVAFPILVLNTLDWFAGDSGDLVTSYRTGTTWEVPLASTEGGTKVRVTGPHGAVVEAPVERGRALVHGVYTGVYTIRHGTERLKVAANLADPDESRIKPLRRMVVAGRTLKPPEGFGTGVKRELWIYLLLAAIALSLLEWLTYNRRMTI